MSLLDEGKNPGLGIRELHRRGITGRGVAIAIIDQDPLVDHMEYKDRLRLYEEIDPWKKPQIHGAAAASIAAGKTVGVAPEADIYCFAIRTDGGRKARSIARSIDRILEINRTLPKDRKIKVTGTSCSWRPGEPGYEEADAITRQAAEQGIFVVSTVTDRYYDFSYQGLGRIPGHDPDDAASYSAGAWWVREFDEWYPEGEKSRRLLFPMDSRTVASPSGEDVYTFYRVGGWSWCVPYIAGLYALALQVDGDLTAEEFARAALETAQYARTVVDGKELRLGPLINPVGLIATLEHESTARGQMAP